MRLVRKPWFASVLLAAWALVLVLAAVWAAHEGEPTVQEQSDLDTARATVDRAVAAVADHAGARATVDIEPHEVRQGCEVTLARDGTEVDRTVVIRVPEGQEQATLAHLADALPAQWEPRYYPALDHFFADVGDFVALRGGMADDGEIRLTAATGCRPE